MTRRYGLRDDQWERIKDWLPGREGHVGRTAKDNRLFVEAVLYRYRAGIAWRDLPERFGDFRVIHTRHTRWSQSGVWQRIFQALAADAGSPRTRRREGTWPARSACRAHGRPTGTANTCRVSDMRRRSTTVPPLPRSMPLHGGLPPCPPARS